VTWHVCSHAGRHHHSARDPPHEQLLMGLEAGGVSFGVVVVLLFRRGWVAVCGGRRAVAWSLLAVGRFASTPVVRSSIDPKKQRKTVS
jgi:hypothetical protein